jgi:hypothetical protein
MPEPGGGLSESDEKSEATGFVETIDEAGIEGWGIQFQIITPTKKSSPKPTR